MKRASFAIAAVILAGSSALDASGLSAQEGAPDWARYVPRVSVAGAFDARHNGRSEPEMYLGIMSLEWDTHVPGLAVRLDAVYGRRDRASRVYPACRPSCELVPGVTYSFVSSKVTAAGAMLGATYELRDHGTFRPYLLGGAGMLRSHDKYTAGTTQLLVCPTTDCAYALPAPATNERNDRPLTAAAEFGGGMALSFPWVDVFAEARYFAVGYSNTRGLRGAVPVSLGLRF